MRIGTIQKDNLVEEVKTEKMGSKAPVSLGTDWRIMGFLIGFVAVLTVIFYHWINNLLRLVEYQRREAERKKDILRAREYEQGKNH